MTNATVPEPLSYIGPEDPGLGGVLKAEAGCFVVEAPPTSRKIRGKTYM